MPYACLKNINSTYQKFCFQFKFVAKLTYMLFTELFPNHAHDRERINIFVGWFLSNGDWVIVVWWLELPFQHISHAFVPFGSLLNETTAIANCSCQKLSLIVSSETCKIIRSHIQLGLINSILQKQKGNTAQSTHLIL